VGAGGASERDRNFGERLSVFSLGFMGPTCHFITCQTFIALRPNNAAPKPPRYLPLTALCCYCRTALLPPPRSAIRLRIGAQMASIANGITLFPSGKGY
jgi:hypothetical protein